MNPGYCHLCSNELFSDPIIQLNGMPKAAQYYPIAEEFDNDHGIILNVYQCSCCGLVQLNMEPVEYYREVITAASLSEKARTARLKQIKGFVSDHSLAGKKSLEIGCGTGIMLDIMEEAGLQATGIEASAGSVEIGRALGRKMICGYLGDIDTVTGSPFDSFIFLNYLEHLPQPDAIIKKIYKNTTDNAVGFITVPNLEYLLRSKCFYEFVADHVSYFTTKTLSYAFERNGFDALECRTINNDNDILAIVKKREPADVSGQYGDVENLILVLQRIVGRYRKQGKKVAVWGAGHRTLALLALAKLDEIECVIDSAKFKHGRYTPVLHKNIVPPEFLESSDIRLVIVMVPGIYPEEVLKKIKSMEMDIDVAALRGNKIEFL